jgi:hypothetical protein
MELLEISILHFWDAITKHTRTTTEAHVCVSARSNLDWKYRRDIAIMSQRSRRLSVPISHTTKLISILWLVVVGIATGYGLGDRGVGVRVLVRSRISLLHVVQTGSGAHPASYPMGAGGSFLGGKATGAWSSHHSPPISAEVKKNVDLYIHSPVRLHGIVLN